MGKLLNYLKITLDIATDVLNKTAEQIENGDFYTESDNKDSNKFDNIFKDNPKKFTISQEDIDKFDSTCFEKVNNSDCNNNCNEKNLKNCMIQHEPVALDVFNNPICIGDEVIPVDYNDNRASYISIKPDFATYYYCSLSGPINRNVLLKKCFDTLKAEGKVSVSDRSGFYHIEK